MAKVRVGLAALAFLGWCGAAHALALGDIQVHSHLNQVISAEIPISVSNPGEADDLIVELASNEEFERHGIERSEFLSSLRFAVDNGAIKVSSKQIAREPFLTFLLNVRWSGGRLIREYSLLLDPPAVATASSGISKARPASAEQAPAASAPSTSSSTGTATAKAPAKATGPAETAEPAQAAAAPSAASDGGTYGPVSPKETLWSIAYKLRPDPSLTMDQVQIAFVNANPKAFEGGKVNGLRKGSTLRVPTAEEIRAVDPVSAKSQVAAARNAAPPVAVARAETPEPRHEAAPAIAPAPAPTPKAEPAPAPMPAPKVVEPTPQAVSPPPQPVVTPPPAQAPPTEVAQAPKAPAAESAAAPSQAPAPATTAPAPKPAPAAESKPAPKAAPAQPESDLVSTILDTLKGLMDNVLVLYGLGAIVALLILYPVGKKVGAIIAKKRYELAARKAAGPQAAPSVGDEEVTQLAEGPSTEQALQDAAAYDTPAAATQSMAPVAATQAMGDTLQQTMAQTGSQTQAIEPAQAASGKVDFDVTGTFADQTVQIKLDAGDPVSEAEFHRAYGLYDEAALLLKQALEKDPKRTDARVKLAEIYFEASKANEFVEVAKVLKGQLPEAEWQKIALLGTQIAPSNELFSGGGGGGGGSVDISFDEPAAASAPAAPAAAPAPAADAGLDFKLEDVQLDVPAGAPAAAAAPSAPAEGALEFDLGSLSLDTPAAEPAPEAAPAAAPPAADAGLDLGSFDLGAPDATQAAAPAAGGDIVEMGGDLSVGDMAGAGDESSTKLDLARAYIDMGDNDMAKSLLNEVSQQGNDQQKKEAQELLKRVPA